MVPTWAVVWRSYSSWNCLAPSSTLFELVNMIRCPGRKVGYT